MLPKTSGMPNAAAPWRAWSKTSAALEAKVDPEEFALELSSEPFPVRGCPVRGYERVAVEVVDVYGNESAVVREI